MSKPRNYWTNANCRQTLRVRITRCLAPVLFVLTFLAVVTSDAPAAYQDRMERRSQELILPDEYLDPTWALPPVVDPLPPLPGEEDSATSDPLGTDGAGMDDPFGEEIIDIPFEDIGEDFGDDDVIEEWDEGRDTLPGMPVNPAIPEE